MHSLPTISILLLAGDVCGRALQPATPIITPAPSAVAQLLAEKRQGPDAVSLAKVLLTAIPESLRQVAATNLPAVSSILWEEFLDDKKPWWFLELPEDIQSYLIAQFGPQTAIPNPTVPAWSSAVVTESSVPAETSAVWWSSAAQSSTFDVSQSSVSRPSSRSSGSETASVASTQMTATRSQSTGSSTAKSSSTGSSSTTPAVPNQESERGTEDHDGLSKGQKIGVGVGVPLGALGLLAFVFGCCLLRRRRRNKSVNGSVPPSSPGFIPRFAFQEKSYENLVQNDGFNTSSDSSGQDLRTMGWDDDVIDPFNYTPNSSNNNHTTTTNNLPPAMAPALFHTHSSNRARGKRTSYQSLHSVAEVSEPEDPESPVLPRSSNTIPRPPLRLTTVSETPIQPPIAAAAIPAATPSSPPHSIKRKPVPASPTSPTASPIAATLASRTLARQTMPSTHSYSHNTQNQNPFTPSSPVSPLQNHPPKNPFTSHTYVEDYGPEFSHQPHAHNVNTSYDPYLDLNIDIENGLYGGNTSFSRYPAPVSPKGGGSRVEWPLRNAGSGGRRWSGGNRGDGRRGSMGWDRVYS